MRIYRVFHDQYVESQEIFLHQEKSHNHYQILNHKEGTSIFVFFQLNVSLIIFISVKLLVLRLISVVLLKIPSN